MLQFPEVINSTAIKLLWEKVNCTQRNGNITGYIVHYSIDGGTNLTVNITGANNTELVISACRTRQHFFLFSVAAVNCKGIGAFSQDKGFALSKTHCNMSIQRIFISCILHIHLYCLIIIDETLISNLNVNQPAEVFILSWLPPTSEGTFLYEIAVVN